MIPLLSLKNIGMTMGSKKLFENLSLGVFENEKIGLIGPNGAGKSTLLKIMAEVEPPDEGELSQKKSLKVSFLSQENHFEPQSTVLSAVVKHLQNTSSMTALEAEVQATIYLSIIGFENTDQKLSSLSGGWRKRVAIAAVLAEEPDLLILDEPTNHMDWEGILWLESWLKSYKKSLIIVTHDRAFLNNLTNRTIEINKLYTNGYLSFDCNYDKFLQRKEEYIQNQLSLQDSMSNKARREVEWLRAGVKARTTKSNSRIKEAHNLLDNLALVKERNRSSQQKSRLEIDATDRKTKKLIELKNVNVGYDDYQLISDLNLILGPKTCMGFLGENGSGKTSLIKAIIDYEKNYTGKIQRAEKLDIVYFDQKREALPQDINLMEYLGDGSDYAVFKDSSIHVASYASRFLFTAEKMQLKISQLSGGEQARLLIAKQFLKPADILVLDEPTNDLDIETIEIIEEAIKNFNGLVLLVSHDRHFLSQLCQRFLALDGQGGWAEYADVNQWLKQRGKSDKSDSSEPKVKESKEVSPKKKKLSYKEKRQLETIEADIQMAEKSLEDWQAKLEQVDYSNHEQVTELSTKTSQAQKKVDQLYELWDQLEAKQAKN